MSAPVAEDRLDQLLPLLACPACRGSVARKGDVLACLSCICRYPIQRGRPVFLPEGGAVPSMPDEHLSNQPPEEALRWMGDLPGWILNLGAGGTRVKLPNVVEAEHGHFRHTDVVADAHRLPFRDGCFAAAVSFNTFEHLAEPERAAQELHRVLRPGGRLLVHSAFLQPLHEAPHHYFNATEHGMRRWFSSFDIRDVSVSDNFSPGHVLAWLACEMLQAAEGHRGVEGRRLLAGSTLADWAAAWTDPAQRGGPRWELLRQLPSDVRKRFAAGFQLQAVKRPRQEGQP